MWLYPIRLTFKKIQVNFSVTLFLTFNMCIYIKINACTSWIVWFIHVAQQLCMTYKNCRYKWRLTSGKWRRKKTIIWYTNIVCNYHLVTHCMQASLHIIRTNKTRYNGHMVNMESSISQTLWIFCDAKITFWLTRFI